jgi:hypothetical protein
MAALTGRNDILRFSGASAHDPAVARWFAGEPGTLRSIARFWFARMRSCGDDVRELFHDGCPVACVDDAPFGYVNAFSSHVNVGFFRGAALEDPAGLLQGTGKRMRHVKLEPGETLDAESLKKLIDAAYADIKARLAFERARERR